MPHVMALAGPLPTGDVMPLEDLVGPNKFINDLVKEWPLGIDPFAEGDDHVRGVKNVLVNSFPTVAEARKPVSFVGGTTLAEELAAAMEFPEGTTAQRPSTPTIGALRYNSDEGYIERWDGSSWLSHIGVLRQRNVRIGDKDATNQPNDQWTTDKVPAVGDMGPSFSFNIGDGPGGINMGVMRWHVSPDDAGRYRLVIRPNNGGWGDRLILGNGLMIPGSDSPPDSFDPGRGWINAQNGYLINGNPVVEKFESALLTIPASGNVSAAHGFSAAPHVAQAALICKGADGGYAVGDELYWSDHNSILAGGSTYFENLWANSNEIGFSCSTTIRMANKTTGAVATLNKANWDLRLRAFRFA